jgi:hypothetical protein
LSIYYRPYEWMGPKILEEKKIGIEGMENLEKVDA